MAKISIITPVLNQVQRMERCILSVADQNVDVEHIIIDGGSTDGTVEIIERHADKLSYWVSEPDKGQSHAINKGLAIATGTYFNWLNADDQLTRGALQIVLDQFCDGIDVVIGKCKHVDEQGDQIAIGGTRIWKSLEGTLGNYSMGQPSHFYRTETVQKLGGINELLHYCMDMELWFRYLVRFGQNNLVCTDHILSNFEAHSNAKSQSHSTEMLAEKSLVNNALLSCFELPEVLKQEFSEKETSLRLVFTPQQTLDEAALLAHYAWYPMLIAYEKRQMNRARALFKIVSQRGRLSTTEKLLWKARLMVAG